MFQIENSIIEDSRLGKGCIVDVNFTFAAIELVRGRVNATERANSFCPADLQKFAELYGNDRNILEEVLDWIDGRRDCTGPRAETLVLDINDVSLQSPISRVPVLRDFAAFEDHLENTFGKMGLKIPPAWYEQPTGFKGNSTTMFGHDTNVPWPRYTKKMDLDI